MHIIARIIAFTYIAVLMCTRLAATTGAALNKAAWTEMCATAKELTTVPATAQQKLTEAQGTIEALENTALKMAAAAGAHADAGEALILAALAAELRSEAQMKLLNLKELRKTAPEAAAATTAVYGGISEFSTLLTAAQAGTTNGCLADTDGSNVISDKSGLGDCPMERVLSLQDVSATLGTTFAPTGIAKLTEEDVKDGTTNADKCVLFQNAQAGNDRLFQQGAAFLAAGGTLSVGTTTTTLKTNHGQNIKAEPTKAGAALIKQAHSETLELLKHGTSAGADAGKNKVKELASDSHFAATVAKKLKLIGMKGSDSTLEAYAKSKIKSLLAGGGENFDSKWQTLIDTKIYDGKTEEVKTEKASSIASTTELIQSVLYYQIGLKTKFKRANKELEKTQNDYETKPQKPECNGKEQEDCGKMTGCEWNKTEGKCTITEAAQKEAEKDELKIRKYRKNTKNTRKTL